MCWSRSAWQRSPTRTKSRMIVSRCTPVMRSMLRMLFPSTSPVSTWICFAIGSLFIVASLTEVHARAIMTPGFAALAGRLFAGCPVIARPVFEHGPGISIYSEGEGRSGSDPLPALCVSACLSWWRPWKEMDNRH